MENRKDSSKKRSGRDVFADFFEPRCIGIIGSFREGFFGGYTVVKSLLNAGYKGEIYPVNPGYEAVLGLKAYPSIKDLPGRPDVVLIMINARSVGHVLQECGSRGVRAAIVVADGFAERDQDGVRLQKEIVAIAGKNGIRIIGPNTAGIVNTENGFNPCPYDAGYYRLKRGGVAICSQTGMINPQAVPFPDLHLGISKICDLGNKCDVDECDILEYLESDAATKVISLYLEGIKDGQRFLKTARRVARKKPILVHKPGKTRAGARASSSHTGSLALDDRLFDVLSRQAGVFRLDRFHELFEVPKIFSSQPPARGNRLGIITFTGAVGVIALDEGAKYGLTLARLSPKTQALLDNIFPGTGKVPVDLGPVMAAVKDFFPLYPRVLGAVMADENVHALFNILWIGVGAENAGYFLEAYKALKGKREKPIATWVYGPEKSSTRALERDLEDLGFPVFSEPETCIKALGFSFQYASD
ncbi:MAG: CoA-binding protein [Deltaproteobacteria bacterium]|nr:CoA-binding protein [Deltaproteobacteria bacterium]